MHDHVNPIIAAYEDDAVQYQAANGRLDADFYKSWLEGSDYDSTMNPRLIAALDGYSANWVFDTPPAPGAELDYTLPGRWVEIHAGGFDTQRDALNEALSHIAGAYDAADRRGEL